MPLRYRQHEDVLPQPLPSTPPGHTTPALEVNPPEPTDVSTGDRASLPVPPFRTARNVFGLIHQFFSSTPPSHDLEEAVMLQDISYVPAVTSAELDVLADTHDILFHAYPNQSSFELGHWYWNGSVQKSHQSFKELIDIVGHPNFDPDNVWSMPWDKINLKLGVSIDDDEREEWEDEDLSNPQDDELFHYEPYQLRWSAPHLPCEVDIQGELYTSLAFMDAHRELQESPQEEGFIYEKNYSIDSVAVESLLKPDSWVPNSNLLSDSLSAFGFNVFAVLVIDLLHEFELGVWHMLLVHLLHIIFALNKDLVHELDKSTQELDHEVDARSRWQAKDVAKQVETGKADGVGQGTAASTNTKGKQKASAEHLQDTPLPKQLRRKKSFNLQTYKFHVLGDYVTSIHHFGTTDSYSTEPLNCYLGGVGAPHAEGLSTIKCAWAALNNDINNGLLIWSQTKPEKLYDEVGHYLHSNAGDPAMKDFLPQLKDYILDHIVTGAPGSSMEKITHTDKELNPGAFSFIDLGTVLRACHIIPAFSRGQHNSNDGISPIAGDKHDWQEYYINSSADHDALMRFHFGLRVGHIYSHSVGVSEPHNSAPQHAGQTSAQVQDECIKDNPTGIAQPPDREWDEQDEDATDASRWARSEFLISLNVKYVPSMSNVWLYMPQRNSILRLIQLTHLFVTFMRAEFILIGYLADYTHIYPIYCDKVFENDQPWIHVLQQVGTLVVPGAGNMHHIHNLFATMLPELNTSVQFHHALFPFGYPPPKHLVVPDSCAVETPSFSTSMPFSSGHPPLKHFSLADPVLQHAAEMPVIGTSVPCLDYIDLAYSDFNFYDHSTGYSASAVDKYLIPEDTNETQLKLAFGEQQQIMHPNLEWRDSTNTGVDKNICSQILHYMRRWVVDWSFWKPISNFCDKNVMSDKICFLTSLDMTHKTYEDMESHPVITRISETKTVSARWPVLRLSCQIGLRKNPESTKTIEKAISFVLALNLGQSSQVQQANSDLISHQVYHILLLMVKDELKKRKTMVMSEAKVGNEAEAEVEVNININTSANILEPAPMNAIIMAALDHMSSNVLQISAKSQLAKSTISDTTSDSLKSTHHTELEIDSTVKHCMVLRYGHKRFKFTSCHGGLLPMKGRKVLTQVDLWFNSIYSVPFNRSPSHPCIVQS
ncbi:uncharacterized protein BJ212DRAFT_1299342 [Suillus subaureus]|uniref:Uncharacterized protein n=1 Tax=Suillus subaureus TaxID=48587 RepID=A0A9P7JE04_9AGAM|nr:uncharacterized protein BJ212DRAFT_1299342 [Suillus subaureus]KAG1817179.1 hypothetical protein BJ212DRAFT_1299342 [Suillus subaureus]